MNNSQTIKGQDSSVGDSEMRSPRTISEIPIHNLLKFILPSLIGVMLFMTPMYIDGRLTILIAYIIDTVNSIVSPYMVEVSVFITVVPSLLTVLVSLTPSFRKKDNKFLQLLNPGFKWALLRVLGAVTVVLIYFKAGPEWVWSDYTGGVQLYEVAPVILVMCLVSSMLIPLLTDYGLMEFIGTLLSKIFAKVFNLPGRAAVDGLASWLSSSTVGIILTMQQYRDGYYTRKDSATICTNFSLVSIAFSYVMLKFVSMEHVFIQWYFSVAVAGVVCAIIIPKLPPLRNVPDEYVKGTEQKREVDDICEPLPLFTKSVISAVKRAQGATTLSNQIGKGAYIALDIIITIYPAMMIIGVIGLSVIEYTPVIQTLSIPLSWVLDLLNLPESKIAATAMLTGFIDMLMPVIIGRDIESELTRFVVAGVAINGIIFLTEVAVIMLRVNIGLNILQLFVVWCLRLLISLPILTLMGHLFV
ncbi:YjiH family protein [Vibrio splendidus]|uniref:YjiH family protein n=1 Tax=Vibrio splendidus TaxID=29497 RepID=UPI0022367999|nr:YjiH family protein [Vibrio splendidus]MCW4444172.1 YjiH family protein [Vibrio splendidus]